MSVVFVVLQVLRRTVKLS